MPTMPPTFRANGVRGQRQADRDRGSARKRGYTTQWDKESRAFKRLHRLCRYCELAAWGGEPRVSLTHVPDHLYPQQQYPDVFWVKALWVPCCESCHAGPKQAIERRGRAALDALARLIGYPTLDEARG